MTEEVIESLPPIMQKYICTLKKASTDTTNGTPMCESLIMLVEWGVIPDFDFCRTNINYILVYNEGKYGKIEKFEKYLFENTHTYTQSVFQEKFVATIESEEKHES